MHRLCVVFPIILLGFSLSTSAESVDSGNKKQVQADPNCGAKCLYVVLREHGIGLESYRAFERELGRAGRERYSLLQLRDAARAHELHAESAQLSLGALAALEAGTSVILHMNPGHFLVFSDMTQDRVTLVDASAGYTMCRPLGALDEWSGNALLVSEKAIVLPIEKPSEGLGLRQVMLAVLIVLGIAAFGMVAIRFKGWLVAVVFILPNITGCRESIDGKARVVATSDAAPRLAQIFVEQSQVSVGDLHRSRTPHVVAIPLKNMGSDAEEIIDVRISCRCLSARMTSKEIEAGQEKSLDLLLDCSTLGPKNAICTVETTHQGIVEVAVNWNVFAKFSLEPTTISGIELTPGQTFDVAVQLNMKDQSELELMEVSYGFDDGRSAEKSPIHINAQLVRDNCTVTFTAKDAVDTETIGGYISFSNRDDEAAAGVVPFLVQVKNPIDIAPEQLHFRLSEGKLRSQVLIVAEDLAALKPFELGWIGPSVPKCEYEVDDSEGTRIIDFAVTVEALSAVTHLEIRAGTSFVKRLPVVLPRTIE